jgi:hypothetical protein
VTPEEELALRKVENWFEGFDRYNQLVTLDISKNGTYPSERSNRIFELLTKKLDGNFIHGLPEAVFDFALLWVPADRLTRKSTGPSWSWTGWEGPVNFPFDPTNCPDLRRMAKSEGEWFRSEIKGYRIGSNAVQREIMKSDRALHPSLRIRYIPNFHLSYGKVHTDDPQTLTFEAWTISAEGFDVKQLEYERKKGKVTEEPPKRPKQAHLRKSRYATSSKTSGTVASSWISRTPCSSHKTMDQATLSLSYCHEIYGESVREGHRYQRSLPFTRRARQSGMEIALYGIRKSRNMTTTFSSQIKRKKTKTPGTFSMSC